MNIRTPQWLAFARQYSDTLGMESTDLQAMDERIQAELKRTKEQERQYQEYLRRYRKYLAHQERSAASWAQLTSPRPTIFSVTLLMTLLNTILLAFLIYYIAS